MKGDQMGILVAYPTQRELPLSNQTRFKATRTNKSSIGVLWSAWRDGVVAHCVELIALEVEAAISSFTNLGPPQTRFTRSCVCPKSAFASAMAASWRATIGPRRST